MWSARGVPSMRVMRLGSWDALRVGVGCAVVTALAVASVAPGADRAGAAAKPIGVKEPARAKRVDAGHADVSPLDTSLRQVSTDLRVDDNFQGVFEVPGNADQMMRSAGGINAVFSRSDYVATGGGLMPVIPAGTVFYIGAPPTKALAGGHGGASGPDLRVYTAVRVGGEGSDVPLAARGEVGPVKPSTVDDEGYRVSLLWALADREKQRLELEASGLER